jgi:glycosyltransferase involved in cell wall biosynthesis
LKTTNSKYVVVNNGVPISQFAKTTAEVNSNALIMVSRFAESKDQETVIRALQYINSKVVIRFVGDGPNRQRCENLAKELGVFDRTQFLGSRGDIADLIATSYIGIQSSHWEGFGLTAVEIMACGKPIIGTDVDGLKQVIDGAGLVFPAGDERILAKQINALIENPTLYVSVAERCKDRAQKYDITNMATNYYDIYHSL